MTGSGEKSVTVTLSGDEALVLFDWLVRTSDAGAPVPFVDQAEERVLWNVEATLERSLVGILRPDYKSPSTRPAWPFAMTMTAPVVDGDVIEFRFNV